jgi:hypothetical protein
MTSLPLAAADVADTSDRASVAEAAGLVRDELRALGRLREPQIAAAWETLIALARRHPAGPARLTMRVDSHGRLLVQVLRDRYRSGAIVVPAPPPKEPTP